MMRIRFSKREGEVDVISNRVDNEFLSIMANVSSRIDMYSHNHSDANDIVTNSAFVLRDSKWLLYRQDAAAQQDVLSANVYEVLVSKQLW